MNWFCLKGEDETNSDQSDERSFGKGHSVAGQTCIHLESEIREVFWLFDTNNDSSMSIHELGKAMQYLGMNPDEQEIIDVAKKIDADGDGTISFDEFYAFLFSEIKKISDGDVKQKAEAVRAAFRTFDKDHKGYLDAKEFRAAMTRFGEVLSDKEADEMMKLTDIDVHGKFKYEAFVKIWCKTT